MAGRRKNQSMKDNLKVAKKFWRYMKDNDQLLGTRTELRRLYHGSFKPTLSEPLQKEVAFCAVMWCFRSKHMKVIEWKPQNDRENVVYRQGRRVAVDQSYVLKREEKAKSETERNNLGVFVQLKKKLVSDRKYLALDKCGIVIQPKPNKDGIVQMDVKAKILQLTVTNKVGTKVSFRCAILGSPGPFMVDNLIHRIVSQSKIAELHGNSSIDFTVALSGSPNPGHYLLPVAFMFNRENEPPFHIVKYITAEITDDVVTRLRPQTPYMRPKPVAIVSDPSIETERGEPPYMQKPNYVVTLNSYPIPPSLRHQMNIGLLEELFKTYEDGDSYTPESHCEKFSKLLHAEELQMEVDIQKYKMEKAKLIKEDSYLTLDVPGLAENRPSLVRGDKLFVKKLAADGTAEKKRYEGYVHLVGLNKVYLKFSARFHKDFIQNSSYEVEFKFSRTTLKVMHRAIKNAAPYLHLIPCDEQANFVNNNSQQVTKWYDQKVQRNKEQKQAVQNILAGTSKPYPYLVFGPPGTGKTVTVVEAIKQVLDNYPDSKVLACAPSNSAADLILERVAQHQVVPKSQMVRLNAFGRSESAVNKNILEFCVRDGDGYFSFPTKDEIVRKYRFVVTTLITAGRLESLGIPKSHFSHVFIDEAGQGMEPECLVPIAGLLGIREYPGQLVLAGDPKQLGPVLRSPVAVKYGLGMSLLERLMGPKFPCFNRQQPGNEYDSKLVTKLLNNYRSHPSIIELPSEMFYDNELRACADEIQRNSLCSWDGLKKKGFPVIFEAVCGKDQREEKSPSFFNPEEISVVLRYVTGLKEARGVSLETSEIGIISPYHKQVQKIRQELKKRPVNIRDIKVGSVEEFQGQERKVIIISTVRSSEEFLQLDAEHKLGFLKNPKRFNVAITRAKALLIVIGNPDVLCHDKHWRRFIKFCIDNGSFSGSSGLPFQMPEEVDQSLAEKLEKLCLNESSLLKDEADLTSADYEDRPWRSDEQ